MASSNRSAATGHPKNRRAGASDGSGEKPTPSRPAVHSIVTLTINPCIDLSAAVDHVVPDRKLRCGPPRREPGGGGINVARAIRKLGGEALAIYPAGGAAGELLRSLLAAEGVSQRPLPIAGWTRENFNVREETTGHQFRFVLPGPELSAAEQDSCFAEVAALEPFPEYLVASGSLSPGVPVDFLARVARLTRERGGRFVLDASGEAARQALEEGVFLVKPSLREFQHLTGLPDAEESHLVSESKRWIEAGRCEVVVLSLGAAGVLWVTAGSRERLPSPTVPVRSTVGAGDSMLAGIVLRLQQGRPLPEALRFGVAAGAATVMNPGTELCHRADAERLYEQMGTLGPASEMVIRA
jgi:6-phosphofructokinase 2